MLNHIIAFSLHNRLLVLAIAAVLMVVGAYQAVALPKDVFPDLNRPTVTILTEAPGLVPEEVETLVTRPIEFQMNGAAGVKRVRSSSAVGLSIVWVEFDWGTEVAVDRQVVNERLQLARDRLPRQARPVIAPVSSIMGEIMLIGLTSRDGATPPMELRTLAEFTIRNRLLAVEGVSQVTVIGGVLKQYQVLTSPARLAAQDVTLDQLVEAAEKANGVAGGGILNRGARESVIRIDGRARTLQDIEDAPVVWRGNRAVLIKDVADVRFGGPIPRGSASVQLRGSEVVEDAGTTSPPHHPTTSSVILTVQKQPHADTLTLDKQIDQALDQLQDELPADVRIERHIFRQADFISRAIDNVLEAIAQGGVWVFVILFLFLWNLRTSLITLTALPLSILTTALVFTGLGLTINTMTLGGIAVAVGELVDDAIVDIENIYRRLKEAVASGQWLVASDDPHAASLAASHKPLATIYTASTEVRGSIVYATLIVCLVVLPLFFLTGLEGRLFAPLGMAYIIALAASLLVSLTVTPVLASLLLPRVRFLQRRGDPLLLRTLKWLDARLVRLALRHPRAVLGAVAALVCVSLLGIFGMGREFLPAFNEGTLTINVLAEPGTSLAESNRLGGQVERLLLDVPEVVSVARRTGRAEMDEHAEGVHSSELDVRLAAHQQPRPGFIARLLRGVPGLDRWGVEQVGRPRREVEADIESRLANLAGVKVNIGQPISHRLDHILSGVRAQIAVKVFGPDLRQLRRTAQDIENRLRQVPGIVQLQVEPQVEVSQVRLEITGGYGLTKADVAKLLETAYQGRAVAEILDGEKRFDLVVWYDEDARGRFEEIGATRLRTPSGREVALDQVARVLDTTGPNTINREQLQRRLVVSANVRGRDLAGVDHDLRAALAPVERDLRERGDAYRLEYGGQAESQQQGFRRVLVLYACVLVGVFLLLVKCLESWQAALQVLVNVPLALLGSVIALLLVNRPSWAAVQAAPWWQWPGVWVSATTLSMAHLVGFITLTGVVSRNGIMMISHYIHLMKHEGESFGESMIVRGTLERLAPVLMTASVAIMGLVPLALGAGQPGKEILRPLAVVVIGGLVASTVLDQVVTPALFNLFGRKIYLASPPSGTP
jgi:CzcA family heavy metal efflux pump